MKTTKKSANYVQAWSIVFVVCALFAISMSYAATFDWEPGEFLNGVIQIAESPVYTFDNNVSVSESLIDYSSNAVDVGFLYMTVDDDGIITVNLPFGYLQGDLFRLTNTITLIAANVSNEFDQITTPFAFNITNTNDNPNITNTSPSSSFTMSENNSQVFSANTFDIDPTFDTVNVTWFFNGAYVKNQTNFSQNNHTYNTSFSSAGNHTFLIHARDQLGGFNNFTWDVDVVNVNLRPTLSATTPVSSSTIYINETDHVNLSINYSDPDAAYPSIFEDYLVDARWRINDVINFTLFADNNSNFTYSTTLDTVLPPNKSIATNVSVVITDGNLSFIEYWVINVSYVNQPPNITQTLFDGTPINYGSIYNSSEGEFNTISFSTSDPDDNVNLQQIYIDSVLNVSNNLTSIYWNFSDEGLRNITVLAQDEDGEMVNRSFLINVSPNTAPNITNFTIFNSTGGFYYLEGDILNISFNFTDIDNNSNGSRIALNQIPIAFDVNTTQFALNYSSRGTYNVSVTVEDVGTLSTTVFNETIQIIAVDFNPTITSSEISNISAYYSPGFGEVFFGTENEAFNITFNVSDRNGNDTIDIMQINITDISNAIVYSIASNSTEFESNFSSEGLYNISFFVNDTTGRINTTYFYLNLTNNTRPNLTNIMVINSTGGNLSFIEGDYVNISFACEDSENNDFLKTLIFNGTTIVSSTLQNQQFNYTHYFSYEDRGIYTYNITCNDDEGLLAQYNTFISVDAVELPPVFEIVNATNSSGVVNITQNDTTIFLSESNTFAMNAYASDLNGNQSISTMWILFNQTIVNTTVGRSIGHTFQTNFSSSGIYNISVIVQDTSSQNTTRYFYLNVSDNSPPEFLEFNVINSTGGNQTYREAELINITAVVNNSLADIINTTVSINATVVCSLAGPSCNYSWSPGYQSRGNYTIFVYSEDQQGLNTTVNRTITLLGYEVAPTITTILTSATRQGASSLTNGSVESITENENVSISFFANDLNGNDTIINYTMLINDVVNATQNTTVFVFNYTSEGMYVVRLIATDNTNLNATAQFNISVQNNTAPILENVTFLNESGSNVTFRENDNINITFDAIDNQGDGYRVEAYINTTQIITNQQLAFSQQSVTVPVPFVGEGNHTFSVIVYDLEGLNASFTTVINVTSGDRSPIVTSLLVNTTGAETFASNGQVVNVTEGELIDLTAFLSDPNGNDTLDTSILLLNATLLNQTLNKSQIGTNITFGYGDIGAKQINIFVNDSLGLNITFNSTLFVLNNDYPEIINITILNSTGGYFIAENTTAIVTVNATDNNSNIINYTLYLNGGYIGNSSNLSVSIPSNARGTLNITGFVIDTEGLMDNLTINTTINSTEIPPSIQSPRVRKVTPQANELIINYSINTAIEFSFFGFDPNGNQTIVNETINISTSLTSSQYVTNNQSITFGSSSAGVLHNVTYYVEDESGLNSSLSFVFLPQNIEEVEVETPSSGGSGGSSGGGGGGGSSYVPPEQPDVKIQDSAPVVLKKGEEYIHTFTIKNKGLRALSNINISALVNNPDVFIQVLSYPQNISSNESIQVKVLMRNINASSSFEVAFDILGTGAFGKEFSDQATVFVNAQAEQSGVEQNFDANAQVLTSLLKDNAKCLELLTMVDDARLLAESGEYESANEVLEVAKNDCLQKTRQSQQPLNAIIPPQDNSINRLIVILIAVVLIVLILPTIFILYRKIHPRKEEVDQKEEEIEKFLEEFYE